MPTAPAKASHSRDDLVARLGVVIAEASALAHQRDACEAEARRIIMRLARMPEIEAPLPTAEAPVWISLKAAARECGRSTDTLRRHGVPAGFVWKVGGRWVADPSGIAEFMKGASRARA